MWRAVTYPLHSNSASVGLRRDLRAACLAPAAMAQIAERADQFGARWVVTFVDEGNAASLKGCARAGFVPYLRRDERFRLFQRRVSFTPVSPAASPE
jgi:hypothetical protein